jgi:hypothetical protein
MFSSSSMIRDPNALLHFVKEYLKICISDLSLVMVVLGNPERSTVIPVESRGHGDARPSPEDRGRETTV